MSPVLTFQSGTSRSATSCTAWRGTRRLSTTPHSPRMACRLRPAPRLPEDVGYLERRSAPYHYGPQDNLRRRHLFLSRWYPPRCRIIWLERRRAPGGLRRDRDGLRPSYGRWAERIAAPPKQSVHCVAFALESARIATGFEGGSACVWDAASGKALLELKEHTDHVWELAFSPDGGEFAMASIDGMALASARVARHES
ncbi:hypothetical protein PsYK624_060550 [Phanerochaete sordida]|uniref:Anaphase-promoting complex subunit 4 WD40 domain-containing protein n=1 Tax=Phanerochaete sordida TaxID=48140 RepID=A0A9P3G816_9APHY|nr:hypothetical protein PsYK624_060550 [Phanerochaete sordida]